MTGMQCWDASGNLIFDVNTMTSRVLGSRLYTTATQEAVTAPVAPGKSIYWTVTTSGSMVVIAYRLPGQGPNQITYQTEGAGTANIVIGEY